MESVEMIFSGRVFSRTCKDCGLEYYRVAPSSILFVILLILAGTVYSLGSLTALLGRHWWLVPLAILANVLVVVVLFDVVDRVKMKLRPMPDVCPKCGQTMVKAGGFYDFSFIPTLQELLSTAVYAILLVALRRLT